MQTKAKRTTIVILIIAIIIIVAGFIFNNQSKNKLDLDYIYSASDFVDTGLDAESLQRLIQRLNINYESLREAREDGDYYNNWIDIGVVKQGLKDFEGAIVAWEQAIALDDQRSLAYANLANSDKSFVKDFDQAEFYYQQAIANDNIGYFFDYESYAELYVHYLPEDSNKVEEIMMNGADKTPTQNKIVFYHYLYNYFQDKDSDKADFYRQQILEINPNYNF